MTEHSSLSDNDLYIKTKREIFLIWIIILIGSILVLWVYHKYSPYLIQYLESKNPRIFIDKATKLITDKKYDEAIQQIQQAIKIYPSDPSFHILLGDVYERSNKSDEAIAAFEQARKINPSDWTPYYRIGVVRLNQKKYSEAVDFLQDAAKRNTTERWLYNALGWAAFENNQLEMASKAWRQASSIVPMETSYYYYLALIHNKRKEWNQSLSMYEKIIALDSTQISAYDLAAESALQLENTILARQYWSQVLSRNPNSVSALRGLGRVEIKSSQWNQSLHYLEKARSLQPDNKEILSDLITVYRHTGNNEKALQLEKLLKSS